MMTDGNDNAGLVAARAEAKRKGAKAKKDGLARTDNEFSVTITSDISLSNADAFGLEQAWFDGYDGK